MKTELYPAHVFWSDEDQAFIAIAPDLPGCSAVGDTQEEALRELQIAIDGTIEAHLAVGNPVPPPSTPAVEPEFSGKLLLRMPKWLHAHLVKTAKAEGVSLNAYVTTLLAAASAAKAPPERKQSEAA